MQPETRCKAHKRNGERCGNPPMHGGTVCRMHGGASPRAREAARRNVERAEAERAVAALGLHRDIEPTEAILEEVRRAAGNVAWLEAELRDMDPGQLFWGRKTHEHGITAEGPVDKNTDAAEVHVKYQLYLTERAAVVAASKAALQAGVQERMVRVQEAQAAMVAAAQMRILERLGVPLTDQARAIVVEELQALEGNPA